ncbi:MAG: hypothetical protein GTN69_03455 [Armatimonadetes bacterium]|nr:hypothetical protein [Armatimonadota bacterium]
MKERPILFNTAMVRAILDGRKTQTRRVVKPQPEWKKGEDSRSDGWCWAGKKQTLEAWPQLHEFAEAMRDGCPYGVPGDRLSLQDENGNEVAKGEITDVRVERVQDISNADAKAEGCISDVTREPGLGDMCTTTAEINARWGRCERPDGTACEISRGVVAGKDEHWGGFREVWDEVYAKRPGCSWLDNPWVWAVSFRVLEPAEDAGETR